MELKDLIAISGYPGLFRFITQGRNSIIVESLEDGKRISAYSTSKMSTLEEIAVYTETEEMPLAEVLKKMYEFSGGKEALPHKSSNDEIREYFGNVLPDYDRDKVYVSDMKKIIHWYNLLVKYGLAGPGAEETTSGGNENEDGKSAPASENKPGDVPGNTGTGLRNKAGGNLSKANIPPKQPGKTMRQRRKT
jgi:hypothetical protein